MEEINQHISTVTLAALLFLFFIIFFLSFLLLYFKRYYRFEADKKYLELQFQQEVAAATIEIQEDLFSRFSIDIHDNVNQTLSLAKVQLAQLSAQKQSDMKLVDEAKHNISDAIHTLRSIAKSMNGDAVLQNGFFSALKELIDKINTTDLIHIKLIDTGGDFSLPPDKLLLVFRMVQEVIQNVLKHAEATLLIIRLSNEPNNISISIHDNGKGFDVLAESIKGIGLKSLHKRALMLGGKLSIQSSAQKGTTVHIQIK